MTDAHCWRRQLDIHQEQRSLNPARFHKNLKVGPCRLLPYSAALTSSSIASWSVATLLMDSSSMYLYTRSLGFMFAFTITALSDQWSLNYTDSFEEFHCVSVYSGGRGTFLGLSAADAE